MSTRKMAFLFACMSVGALASACGDEVGGMLLNCTPGDVQCVDEDYMQACIGVSWVKTQCPAKCDSTTGQCKLTPDMECAVTTCKAGVKNVLIECSSTFKATEVECGEGQECQYNQCVDVDLCRVGAVKCSPDNSGTMTCNENGKWGSVVSCGDMVCDSESHECKDKSEAKVCDAGSKKCDGNKALVCADNAWTSEDCGSKICKEGVCEESGEAKCSAGDMKCDGSKLMKCDANGVFVEDKDCAADGQICQNNACVEDVEAKCSAGDMKCDGSKVMKCDDNGVFVEDKDCAADGQICQNNACVAAETSACSEGQIKCVEDGGSKYVSCDGSEWGTTEAECDANMICNKGACVVKICDDGDERCSSDSMGIEKCSGNVWSVASECVEGQRCDALDFACKDQSEAKVCKEGEMQCDGDNKIKTCKADNTWDESVDCVAETPICNADLNACVAKACDEGAMECTGSNTLKVCSGGIWSVNVCTEGSVCENNQCVAKSADVCSGSEKSCSNDKGAVMVCDGGVWKVDMDCSAEGKACDASGDAPVCVVSCKDVCDGDKIKRCDEDGNLGDAEDCGSNKVCSVSGDVASCVDKTADDKCVAGEKVCDGTDKIKVCDDKGEWGSVTACGAGMKCDESSKECVTDATSTSCNKGDKRCVTDTGDNVYQACGNDGKWGAAQTCGRNTVCSGGNCVTCVPGSTVCDGGMWGGSNKLNTCKADGSGYDSKECENGCQNGACRECTNNEMKCTDDGKFQICRNGAWVEYDCGAKDKCSTKTGYGSTPGCVCNSGRNADMQCAANGDVQTCTQQGGGFGGQAYNYWATTMSCGEGMCENNKCKCSNGDKRCSSDNRAVETCDKNGAWQASSCGADMVCDAGKKACVCEENDVRCHLNNRNNEVQTCKNGEWKTDKTCDRNDICNVELGGVCLKESAVACTGLDNNTKTAIARQEGLDASAIGVSCNGNVLYTCTDGVSSEMQTCSIACQEDTYGYGRTAYAYCATKASTPDTTCYRENSLRCSDDGSEVQKCVRGNVWSMNWQKSESCDGKVCQDNKCVEKTCEEGAYDCNGTNITICRNNKKTDIVNCNDYGKKCDKGVCVAK